MNWDEYLDELARQYGGIDAALSALVAMGRETVTPVLAAGRYVNDAYWGDADASDAMDWARDYMSPMSRDMGPKGRAVTGDLVNALSDIYNSGAFGMKQAAESKQFALSRDAVDAIPEDYKAGAEMFAASAGVLAPLLRVPHAIDTARRAAQARRFDNFYTPDETLDVNDKAIQDAFAEQLRSDMAGASKGYEELPGSMGGKITSVDETRELDAIYPSNRGLSKAVHEPASAFSKVYWQDTIKGLNKGDSVMLMSGGTGAGKTSSIVNAGIDVNRYDAIFDSNLQDFGKAKAKIDDALDNGLKVEIVHVWRDPMAVFTGPGSALSRAMKNYDTPSGMKPGGRTVPIGAHIGTHEGANKTIKQIEDAYRDNPNVTVRVVDNTGSTPAEAKPSTTGAIPENLGAGINEEALHEALYRAYIDGDIDLRTLLGFDSSS